ncbi:hypothetical protein SAMN06296036_113162 [Pseudobacteriovorax antillogorgiicola]|uniref:Uncharacterized protein n=2 Tax=Pseudobacteriovorax antillogorgiicola TaxID=1513793 RepID=A0A1Y6C4D3_9BACT|nr:hypothetical protein EDD56_114157 [Pseudobacteriovorax antillogorgiicola]SMF44897.1 hypothetical protein SAMN06296036_113162 [Pseudobacteriovorax antillogorgiicola]
MKLVWDFSLIKGSKTYETRLGEEMQGDIIIRRVTSIFSAGRSIMGFAPLNRTLVAKGMRVFKYYCVK